MLLRRLAAGRDVTFAGAPPDEALPSLYRAAAVFVLPSVHHTYGRYEPTPVRWAWSCWKRWRATGRLQPGRRPSRDRAGRRHRLPRPGDVAELRERLAELLGDTARRSDGPKRPR
jgi:glycosyltransferase involved in cell wall biosynthesis